MRKFLLFIFIIISLVLSGCQSKKENELTTKQQEIYQMAVKVGYNGTYQDWLDSIKGEQGIPGKNVELSVEDGNIKWKNKGDNEWYNLISLDMLKGNNGEDGLFAYESYKINYPEYIGDETQWLNDLINGKLSNESNTCTVEFYSDNIKIDSKTIVSGSSLVLPIPVKEGYDFIGWFSGFSVNDGQFFNYIPVTSNLTLFAKWSIKQYTLDFETNGGNYIETANYEYMSPIILPENPYRNGYEFLGWYEDIDLLQPFTDTTMPGYNTIIYAKWIEQVNYIPNLGGYTIKIALDAHAIWYMDPFHVDYDAFDKNAKQQAWNYVEEVYNCKIKFEPYPDYAEWGTPRWQYIEQKAAAGAVDYDFYVITDSQISRFVNANSLFDMTEWYNKYGNGFMDSIFQISGSYKNRLYSLIDGQSGILNVMYYNIGLLEELNMDKTPAELFNEGEWTYSKFKEYAITAQERLNNKSDGEYWAVAGNSPYYWVGMSNAGGVKLADVTNLKMDIKNLIAISAADTLKSIKAAGAMDPNKQIDANVHSWMTGRALFSSGDLWFVNASNRWPDDLWGEGDMTRYGYVPFPRPDGTELKDQRIGLSGGTAMVMPIGRNYSGYGEDCTPENVYRAIVDIFIKTKEFQLSDPDYSETNQIRLISERYTESEDSIEAFEWILNNIKNIGFYDPLANANNPIVNTGFSTFSTSINEYIMGTYESYSAAVDPLLPSLEEQLIKVFS